MVSNEYNELTYVGVYIKMVYKHFKIIHLSSSIEFALNTIIKNYYNIMSSYNSLVQFVREIKRLKHGYKEEDDISCGTFDVIFVSKN